MAIEPGVDGGGFKGGDANEDASPAEDRKETPSWTNGLSSLLVHLVQSSPPLPVVYLEAPLSKAKKSFYYSILRVQELGYWSMTRQRSIKVGIQI